MKDIGSIVVNVGSGYDSRRSGEGISLTSPVMIAGLDIEVHGVMGRTGSKDAKHDAIYMKAVFPGGCLFDEGRPQYSSMTPGGEYTPNE